MARGRPWYKRHPERWIMGTRGLTLEERGAYSEIVDYLNLRDHALPDDIKVVAALLGCPPQTWRRIRAVLLKAKKLEIVGDYITNPRFEREKAERDLARAEAVEHGREGGKRSAELRAQNELDFEHDPQISADPSQGYPPADDFPVRARTQGTQKSSKSSNKTDQKVATKLPVSENAVTPVSQKTANNGQGYPQPPVRAREEGEEEEVESPPNSTPTTPREDSDRMHLLEQVCEASGYQPTSAGALDRSLRQVEAWMKEGVDFDEVVIPTIRRVILDDPQPTRTLGRFTKHIAHEHARRNASKAKGSTYRPPKVPLLKREDEPDRMADLRQMLCQVMGANLFAIWFNTLRLEPDEEMPNRLNIHGHMSTALQQSNTFPTVSAVARRMGYTFLCPK